MIKYCLSDGSDSHWDWPNFGLADIECDTEHKTWNEEEPTTSAQTLLAVTTWYCSEVENNVCSRLSLNLFSELKFLGQNVPEFIRRRRQLEALYHCSWECPESWLEIKLNKH